MSGIYLSAATTPANVGARPSGAGDGVDISSWSSGTDVTGPERVCLLLDGSQAATVDGPSGATTGAEVWGYLGTIWYLLGYLHDGADIPITGNAQGFALELGGVGIFDRLAVAGDVSAGTVTYSFAPMETV